MANVNADAPGAVIGDTGADHVVRWAAGLLKSLAFHCVAAIMAAGESLEVGMSVLRDQGNRAGDVAC